MQQLANTVGEGSSVNALHDRTLVQAILFACRRPAIFDPIASRYLTVIDGDFGDGSKKALRLFQNENVFVDMARRQSVLNPNATPGMVKHGDATWQAMLRVIDPAYSGLRILPNSKVPYLEGSANDLNTALAAVNLQGYQPSFAQKVSQLIRDMHTRHGIVLSVCPEGGRRTFQKQYELLTGPGNVTNAGPGESNHNFGQATDIGFKGLRWLRTNGTIETAETAWLHKLSTQPAGNAKALVFWNMQREVGTGVPAQLFRGPESDRPHLQAWSDAAVSMKRSLAGLLTATSGMQWQSGSGGYATDFGLGGTTFHTVGTAAQIWSKTGPLSAAALQANSITGPTAAAATLALRDSLREAFDTAETNWASWLPL